MPQQPRVSVNISPGAAKVRCGGHWSSFPRRHMLLGLGHGFMRILLMRIVEGFIIVLFYYYFILILLSLSSSSQITISFNRPLSTLHNLAISHLHLPIFPSFSFSLSSIQPSPPPLQLLLPHHDSVLTPLGLQYSHVPGLYHHLQILVCQAQALLAPRRTPDPDVKGIIFSCPSDSFYLFYYTLSTLSIR